MGPQGAAQQSGMFPGGGGGGGNMGYGGGEFGGFNQMGPNQAQMGMGNMNWGNNYPNDMSKLLPMKLDSVIQIIVKIFVITRKFSVFSVFALSS